MEADRWVGRSPTSRPVGFVGLLRDFNGRRLTLKVWAWNSCPYFLQLYKSPPMHQAMGVRAESASYHLMCNNGRREANEGTLTRASGSPAVSRNKYPTAPAPA